MRKAIADFVYGPFERFVKPLDLPVRPLPDTGPFAVVLHFAALFRWVLLAVGVLSILSGLIGLATVWAVAFIVDGVSQLGPVAFLERHALLIGLFFLLLAVIDPIFAGLRRYSGARRCCASPTGFPPSRRWIASSSSIAGG